MALLHALSGLIRPLGRSNAQVICCLSACLREASTSAAAAGDSASQNVVLALLQEELSTLSIPAGELQKLVSSGLSDAALTAWALTKTSVHPAADKAAAASQRLRYLLAKLDGATLRQQAAETSPAAELLWHVAVSAAQQQLRGMSAEQLEACVEYKAALAAVKSAQGSTQHEAALQLLEAQLPHLVDTSPRNTLAHPAFWQLASAAAASSPGLTEDLTLLGYDLAAAATVGQQQLQQVQQLLGLDAALLQQQLASQLSLSGNTLLPEHRATLMQAAASSAPARALLGQLQLIEVLAACLGLSAVQLSLPPSSSELVRRLTGRASAAPAISEQLSSAIRAAGPALVEAVSKLPASSLEQPGVVRLMQLMDRQPELQAVAQALAAWRAEAAAAGSLPVLVSLCQSEVALLSSAAADAVGRHVMQLQAQARLLARQAAAGQLDLAGLGPAEADALAWQVHTGGVSAAEDLVGLVLVQADAITAQHVAEVDAAGGALSALAAGFELEEATSRRSTAAPPSAYLMAGIPYMQLEELAQGTAPASEGADAASEGADAASGANGSKRVPAGRLDAAERLVRDLALLVTSSSGGDGAAVAVQRLQYVAHDLPRVLSGPLLELLAAVTSEALTDADSLRKRQQQLATFLAVVAAELPQQLMTGSSAADASAGSSSWLSAGQADSQPAAEGLLELLGEQDSGEVLRHAAERQAGARSARWEADTQGGDDEGHLYGWLANIHHDQDMQRYLQMEFDPSLAVDMAHTPRGWRDSDLFTSSPDFLEGMRPLLDTYLAAQGEAPLQDIEWQVYRDAALAEADQVEAEAAAARAAAGHSPFNNSRADEAYLRERLEAGIPPGSVLYAAAHKYLTASFHNRTWRFAQRKRMVDVLIAIADHLAAHPPRSHRGSPFSALFQPDGPPLVPRVSQQPSLKEAACTEAYALPAGFGGATTLPPQ